tara:strand:+ start:6644 stop:7252 length:609 start_codon:yes stop_codon:yes gene_type:complete
MAKWPAYGRGKSRLSKDIGKKYALNIQKHMLLHTVSVSKFLENNGHLDISLATTGIGFRSSKKWCKELGLKNFNLQGKGNLGERMKRQVLINKKNFQDDKRDYLIIGTDLPDLCHLDLYDAISKIKKNDLIFGPSEDGGYWLIGLSRRVVSQQIIFPFIDIKWSRKDVLKKTLDNLSIQKLKIDFLSCKVDIDTVKDLDKRN